MPGEPASASRLTLQRAFGEVIRAARAERGLSQERLAHDSGYDRTYLGLLERGQRNPSLLTVIRVASVLGMKPSELIGRVEDRLGRRLKEVGRPKAP